MNEQEARDFGISTDRVCLEIEHDFYDADAPGVGEVAVPDPVAPVLTALDADAEEHLNDIRPDKTKDG